MIKKSPPDETKMQEWEDFLRHVKPLQAKARAIKPVKETSSVRAATPIPQSFATALDPFLGKRDTRKTRNTEPHPERVLDLHGYTENAAWKALTRALAQCAEQQIKRLLIITGKGAKGEGVLRQAVPRWLKESELARQVQSITQAPEPWGGLGAWIVRIKN